MKNNFLIFFALLLALTGCKGNKNLITPETALGA